jgi:hypothetical protein
MNTQQLDRTELNSIIPPLVAQADLRISLDELRARFARNEGLPFADVLTEASIRGALDDHRPALPAAAPQRQIVAATPEAAAGRVISVAHRMADVKPDEQIVVDTELGEFDLYLWKAETLRGN